MGVDCFKTSHSATPIPFLPAVPSKIEEWPWTAGHTASLKLVYVVVISLITMAMASASPKCHMLDKMR